MMARFFVGQRVKVVRRTNPKPEKRHPVKGMVGDEAVIAGTMSRPNAGFAPDEVCDTSIFVPRLGVTGMVPASVLEPITNIDQTPAELTVEELLPFLKTREVV